MCLLAQHASPSIPCVLLHTSDMDGPDTSRLDETHSELALSIEHVTITTWLSRRWLLTQPA